MNIYEEHISKIGNIYIYISHIIYITYMIYIYISQIYIYTYIYHTIYHISYMSWMVRVCLSLFESVWVLQLLGEAVTQDFVEIVQMVCGRLLCGKMPWWGHGCHGTTEDVARCGHGNLMDWSWKHLETPGNHHQTSWNIMKHHQSHTIQFLQPIRNSYEIHQDHIRSHKIT